MLDNRVTPLLTYIEPLNQDLSLLIAGSSVTAHPSCEADAML